MSLLIPQVHVGAPTRYQSLSIFPLFTEAATPAEYQLADEAISAATVAVQEVGEQGTVPELLVENTGDSRVLFLEGEELRGAKQNRVLNTSILVPSKATIKVPVSCVEQGRWRHVSKHFSSGKTRSPHSLLYKLKSSVTRSVKETGSHRSDQGEVWNEVAKTQATFACSSVTGAMSDTYDHLADKMKDYREQLKYPEGAVGVAVALGPKVVSVDLFDKPSTCEKAWDRLLSGLILDALEVKADGQPEPQAVERIVRASVEASWSEAQTVGEGKEYRTEFNGTHGSALLLDNAVIHLNVLTPPA